MGLNINSIGEQFKNGFIDKFNKDISNEDLDRVISQMTTLTNSSTYSQQNSPLYGTFKAAIDSSKSLDSFEPGGSINDEITEYRAWDPRLARVDGFVSRSSTSDDHPTVVPFASETAAGAFYDLVFTVEKAVGDKMTGSTTYKEKSKETDKNGQQQTASSEKYYTVTEDGETIPDVKLSTKNFYISNSSNGQKLRDTILNDGNSYGVASIVNPYTLTKLCGGLVKVKSNSTEKNSDDIQVENHMYDIRNSRRFYGDIMEKGGDVLTVSNPTTTNIITWSNKDKWGRTPYYFQDFVFCKYWNVIPNNRLITLRKYHAPVYDNLQFSNMFDGTTATPFAPIATVITYFGDDTGNTLSSLFGFTAGTKWKEIPSDVHDVQGESGSDPHALIDEMFTGGGGFPTGESNVMKNIIGGANLLTGKMFSLGKFVGLLSPGGYNMGKDQNTFDILTKANVDPSEELYSNKIKGPVNRINTTKARDAGITFDQKFSLTCQYIARPIGGVNTKAAMLDILSNCMEMASADAVFWGGGYRFNIHPQMYPFKNTAFKNRIMDDLYAGRIFGKDGALSHTVEGIKSFGTDSTGSFSWSEIGKHLSEYLGETLGALGEMFNTLQNMVFGANGSSIGDWLKGKGNDVGDGESGDKGAKKLNSLGQNLNMMWRSKVIQASTMPSIHGMRALLTGEPVGNWHLTVGNPLNPIMVIGNLICTDMKVEVGEELGPDDFPTELKVVYTLEHGMPRDKSGIQSMFNRGSGRIYQLPDWIRASSDYESKVDNFTGGSNFYQPKYMNASKMMAIGGAHGYQTYKIDKGKNPAMDEHTSNTVIAKFTPPDVDAAISNIVDKSSSFFGSNNSSRAWIRGTAATRKLMN